MITYSFVSLIPLKSNGDSIISFFMSAPCICINPSPRLSLSGLTCRCAVLGTSPPPRRWPSRY